MNAVRNRKEQIIEILLSKGANTMVKNQYDSGDSALHYACDEGDMRIALLIVSHSTNIDLTNNEGMTPLMYALQKKHLKLAETLLTMGADPFVTDNNQLNAIDWARKVGVSNEFIEKLSIDAGDFDQISKEKRKVFNNETFIEFTDRSFVKNEETLQNPGIIKKTLSKTFDFLITNQISWVKD